MANGHSLLARNIEFDMLNQSGASHEKSSVTLTYVMYNYQLSRRPQLWHEL